MAHSFIPDLADTVSIQDGAVVSKVIHRDDDMNVTMFGFDRGERLTEHTASRPAIVEVVSGRLSFVVDGEEVILTPGTWLHMPAGASHSLKALEPTLLLLTLVKPDS